MIGRLLCLLGFHRWIYHDPYFTATHTHYPKECIRCKTMRR